MEGKEDCAKWRPVDKEGQTDFGAERWKDLTFFCNGMVRLGLRVGIGELSGPTGKHLSSECVRENE